MMKNNYIFHFLNKKARFRRTSFTNAECPSKAKCPPKRQDFLHTNKVAAKRTANLYQFRPWQI